MEDIANAKKGLRRQAFSVENIDANYENYPKNGQDYQNIPFLNMLRDTNIHEQYNDAVDYQNIDIHTYQNVHKNLQIKEKASNIVSHSNVQNNERSISKLDNSHNICIKQNVTEEDGLYESYNTQYAYNQNRSHASIKSQGIRNQAKQTDVNYSHNTVFENKSKLGF